jgi:hypothetical protein
MSRLNSIGELDDSLCSCPEWGFFYKRFEVVQSRPIREMIVALWN